MEHDPDPRFLEHLEWQLTTSSRRRSRFARPTPSLPARAVRTALLAVFCLVGGAGVVVAAERIQDQERRAHLVAKLEIECDMARLRIEHARRQLEHSRRLVERGMVGEHEHEREKAQVFVMETELFEKELDLEEVRSTGVEPRHDLAAPLVGGKDFVMLRLQRRYELAARQQAARASSFERARMLADAGMITSREVAGEEAHIRIAQREVDLIARKMEIRSDFAAGKITPVQVELLERVAVGRHDLEREHLNLIALTEELEQVLKLESVGVASGESGPLELEVELARRRIELRELELDLLLKRLEER